MDSRLLAVSRAVVGVVLLVLAAGAAADTLVVGGSDPAEVVTVAAGDSLDHQGDIWVVGHATLRVEGTLRQTGQLRVVGDARLEVAGGTVELAGNDTNLWVLERGVASFTAGAHLHYRQTYVAQHALVAVGDGRLELADTDVDSEGSVEFIYLLERASYTARRVTSHSWRTWYLWDTATLDVADLNIAGDIVFYDSPTIRIARSAYVMPWLYLPDGAVVDTSFPAATAAPISRTIDGATPGFVGIGWSLELTSCRGVVWGIDPYPGSDVTIRDSALQMVLLRYLGAGAGSVDGVLRNGSHYDDETVPVDDRSMRLVNSDVTWWKVDVGGSFTLTARDLAFSEMMVTEQGRAEVDHSVCQGQTIHLGAQDQSFVRFTHGSVWSYVSVWDEAVMVLDDSVVDWTLARYLYQTRNIAHGSSRLYCLNSWLRSPPEAVDAAVVLVARVDDPLLGHLGVPDAVPVSGVVWLATGPDGDVRLSRWALDWARDDLAGGWHTIATGSAAVRDGQLGVWQTGGLTPGRYRLRLTAWSAGDDGDHPTADYPAVREVTLGGGVHTTPREAVPAAVEGGR